jgi:uncharacterized membrane protein YraQ (UPF0718 family)
MNAVLYALTGILVLLSLVKSREKTVMALRKAWRSFENILPQLLVVLLLVGSALALLDSQMILSLIGSQSGWAGVAAAAVVGAVTLIPGFVAFPLAAMLLESGAGYMQIAAFISSLMMVGIVTLPVEIAYFGRRVTIFRNTLAFAFSFFVAFVIGAVQGVL